MKAYRPFMLKYYILFFLIVVIYIVSIIKEVNFIVISGYLTVLIVTCFCSIFTLKIKGDKYVKDIYPNVFNAYVTSYPKREVFYAELGTKPIALALIKKVYPKETDILGEEWHSFLKDTDTVNLQKDARRCSMYITICIIFIPIASILSAVI